MTTIIIFGVSEKSGLLFLHHALAKGYRVKAFVSKITILENIIHPNLQIIQGDIFDQTSLLRGMKNIDTVVCCLKNNNKEKRNISIAIEKILLGMKELKIRRMIYLSSINITGSEHSKSFIHRFLNMFYVSENLEDNLKQEIMIKNSELEWIIIKPPQISENVSHGNYEIKDSGLITKEAFITRSDLIDCMIELLNNPTYIKKVISIINKQI